MGRRRRLAIGAVLFLWAGVVPAARQTPAPDRPPVVFVAELDGIIHPVTAEYLTGAMDAANGAAAAATVVVLRTPGGLLESTRTIVSRMIASRTPVVVFVGPAGARAASAGFIIAIAADVAAMAPGTHIGAAHPVSGSGQPMDETMAEKAASDTAAYARSLAQTRGRNVELSELAVTESRAFTDVEAIKAAPPLVDIVAEDLDALLTALDGRSVRRFDGTTITLDTAGAEIRRIDMTARQRFLSGIAHPQIAYLLLTLGMLGLTVELWHPGAIVPGVAGGVCLLLAFFALQILPVDTTGLLLVLFGLSLLIAELLVSSFGILGIGGTISFVIGSVMMTSEVPGVAVGLDVIVPVAVAFAAIVLFLGRLSMRAYRQAPATGVEALIGQHGRVRTAPTSEALAQVDVRGEIWRAHSRATLSAGQVVRVTDVNGLTLVVEPSEAPGEGAHAWKS